MQPVGRIRPRQFATMREDEQEDPNLKGQSGDVPIYNMPGKSIILF